MRIRMTGQAVLDVAMILPRTGKRAQPGHVLADVFQTRLPPAKAPIARNSQQC